jgi:hypothetical protein
MKRNNLRKAYLIYIIAIGEFVMAALFVVADYIPHPAWRTLLRTVGCIGFVVLPFAMWVMYRWLKKDNDAASDELERMVLQKAMAITGFAAVTLSPLVLILVSLFTDWAVLIAFCYMGLIWGTLKLSTFIIYKKY